MLVPMMAGIVPPPLREASRCSRRNRRIPRTASKPYTSPPVRSSAWRSMNVFPRSEAAVSYVPGQPPRASAKAMAGGSRRTTVVPVRRSRFCAWPTRTPRIAVSVAFAAMASTRNFEGTAGGIFNGYATLGRTLSREVCNRERNLVCRELRHDEIRGEFLRGEDPGARESFRVDHHDGRCRRGGGQETLCGRASAAVRLSMFHRERRPHGGIRAVAFGAVHLDHDSQGSGKRADQRRRFGDRGHERIAEGDLRHADLHLVVRPQEAQRVECVDRALEFRVDVVLVVDPSDGLAEAGGQGQDLLVPEPVDASLPDRRREPVVLLAAGGFLFAGVLPLPDDPIRQGRAVEHFSRGERETVPRLLARGRFANQNPIDLAETVRGDPRPYVGNPRVRPHRNNRADSAIPPTRVQAELLQDAALLSGHGRAVPRAIDVAASRREARVHHAEIVLR